MQTLERPRAYFVGVDLGQVNDYTAVAVVEKRTRFCVSDERDEQERAERMLRGSGERFLLRGSRLYTQGRVSAYDVVHLDRLPLGTKYPRVIAEVQRLLALPQLRGARLVVDATGVGRPVVDSLRAAGLDLTPVTITSGSSASYGDGGYRHVPKADLVGQLAVLLENDRLRIAAELAHAERLVNELSSFQVRATSSGNDTFGAWRESAHDDLVLALAVAVWAAEQTTSFEPDDWASSREEDMRD